jgi:hypothetical protein
MKGHYCVLVDVWKASNGWYSPRYEIFDGNPPDGAKSLKRETFPSGSNFPNRVIASQFASEMAGYWIAERGANGYEKGQDATSRAIEAVQRFSCALGVGEPGKMFTGALRTVSLKAKTDARCRERCPVPALPSAAQAACAPAQTSG